MSILDQLFKSAREHDVSYWRQFLPWSLVHGVWHQAGYVPPDAMGVTKYLSGAEADAVQARRRAALLAGARNMGAQAVADQQYVYDGGRWNLVTEWIAVPAPTAGGEIFTNVVKGW